MERGRIQGLAKCFEYPVLSQERVKLRTSTFVRTFLVSIGTKVHYKFSRKVVRCVVRTLKTFQGTHILGASRGLLCDCSAVLSETLTVCLVAFCCTWRWSVLYSPHCSGFEKLCPREFSVQTVDDLARAWTTCTLVERRWLVASLLLSVIETRSLIIDLVINVCGPVSPSVIAQLHTRPQRAW